LAVCAQDCGALVVRERVFRGVAAVLRRRVPVVGVRPPAPFARPVVLRVPRAVREVVPRALVPVLVVARRAVPVFAPPRAVVVLAAVPRFVVARFFAAAAVRPPRAPAAFFAAAPRRAPVVPWPAAALRRVVVPVRRRVPAADLVAVPRRFPSSVVPRAPIGSSIFSPWRFCLLVDLDLWPLGIVPSLKSWSVSGARPRRGRNRSAVMVPS
jgi:hypothetical protein